ncbi:hypothetical protein [Propionigenium maris]|uniref:hypothetical protein n=1 Tax=Propionigenium maris TaxID=45622 RepID=UPI0024907C4F|nr:hypothetical protein [Propionigenium maris]
MRGRLIAALMILGGTSIMGATQVFNGEHFTGIEYQHSDIKDIDSGSIDATTLTLGKGYYNFINYPADFEGVFKYDVKGEHHSMANNIGYTSFGGRYQYNGWGDKGIILGMKGSLDYDNFYENYNDYFSRYVIEGDYPRKSGKNKDEEDFGVKFYGDLFKKLDHGFTVGFWNDVVVGKEEVTDPIPIVRDDQVVIADTKDSNVYDNTAVSVTITPKIIYQTQVTESNRFVFEGYMENRKYYNKKFEVEGKEEDRYYKYVLTPQFITKGSVGEEFTYFNYMAFENEKFEYLSFWQHIFKMTPRLEYRSNRWLLGFSGGGYDFEDEIGIIFDNQELFGYKKADTYSAWIFAPKVYVEYRVWGDFYLGQETAYRHGEWETDTEDQYMDETSYIFYWKYEKYITEDIMFILKNSYELYRLSTNIPVENRLPEENIVRVTAGVKAYF